MSNRLSQLIDLLEEAKEAGDTDKIQEIETDMFREFGYDAETGVVSKSMGGEAKDIPAMIDATSNRATNGRISRGGGAALRGTKFKGVR
tara:strand:- start:578 stop:844 length:267 start_codon:yes stop_codon:yes gene_type:complete